MIRKFNVVTVIMLVGQIFLNTFGAVASAATVSSRGEIFSEPQYLNQENQAIEIEKYVGPVMATIDWSIEGLVRQAGDTEEIQLHDAIMYEEQEGDIFFEDISVGSYSTTAVGLLTVVFNEEISNHPEAHGTMTIPGIKETAKDTEKTEDNSEGEPQMVMEPFSQVQTKEISQNLLSRFEMIFVTEDGQNITINQNQSVDLDIENMGQVGLFYDLVRPNDLTINTGDTYVLPLPSIFKKP